MRKKLNSTTIIITIAIALCTSAALIAFAFNQRQEASVKLPAVAFYVVAAAIICLGSELYAQLRSKSCRNKAPNLG